MMRESDIINNLQKDVVIPDIVQTKADLAFEQIMAEGGQKRIGHTKKFTWKTMKVAVAAVVLAVGTVTVGAATYLHWSRGLEEEFHATELQKQYLEEQQIAAAVSDSVTEGGVTITAQQSIVDGQFAYLSFKIEGYELEDGQEPSFENIGISVNGSSDFSWTGSFFNGWTKDEQGELIYADGWAPKTMESGNLQENFVAEDGSMEFKLRMQSDGTKGFFIGSDLHLEFKNLGTVSKAEYFPDMEETWTFDLVLEGSDEVKSFELSETLGDSGATVTKAEISPISVQITYEFAAELVEIDGVDANGEPIKSHLYAEPPAFTGVRLTDGTLLTGICNGGWEGYEEADSGIYIVTATSSQIIDTEEVDALLFIKTQPEAEGELTEEDLYIVPVK